MIALVGLFAVVAFIALVRSLQWNGPVDGKWSEDWYVEPKVRHRLALQKDREDA